MVTQRHREVVLDFVQVFTELVTLRAVLRTGAEADAGTRAADILHQHLRREHIRHALEARGRKADGELVGEAVGEVRERLAYDLVRLLRATESVGGKVEGAQRPRKVERFLVVVDVAQHQARVA